jgi:hypothetical protein
MDEDLMPYLRTRIPVRTLDALSSPQFGANASAFPIDVAALYRDMEFENLINDFYFNHSTMLGYLDRAGAAADTIADMLRLDPRAGP